MYEGSGVCVLEARMSQLERMGKGWGVRGGAGRRRASSLPGGHNWGLLMIAVGGVGGFCLMMHALSLGFSIKKAPSFRVLR